MKKNKWLIIGGVVAVLGIGAFIIYRRNKKAKNTQTSGSKTTENKEVGIVDKVTNIFTGNSQPTTSGEYVINSKLNASNNFQFPQPKSGVDLNSMPIKNLLLCLDNQRKLLLPYYQKDGKLYYRGEKGDTLADIELAKYIYKRTEWVIYIYEKGLNSDTKINAETKEYAKAMLRTFRGWMESVFPNKTFNVQMKEVQDMIRNQKITTDYYLKGC